MRKRDIPGQSEERHGDVECGRNSFKQEVIHFFSQIVLQTKI